MICNFFKYQGTGNDFIVIDNRGHTFTAGEGLINRLCHRRMGIGADGMLLLEDSQTHDFAMRYFNSDGREGSMCGNGGRCVAAFAYRLLKLNEKICFMAVDGEHQAEILNSENGVSQVRLKMTDVLGVQHDEGYFFLDTGSPHYVTFVDDADVLDVVASGRAIRYSPMFPQGTNVDFVEINNYCLYVRTYERGVEDETLSCGTGVTAAAIAASFIMPRNSFDITTRGGKLKVSFTRQDEHFSDIWLEGPAAEMYEGKIDI
ncbi:MAG TPA: diaminopimelate epimerase [Bacteroidales bacterium]|nr:diaminopimelate epimerase [Bacteroidales bacterium]